MEPMRTTNPAQHPEAPGSGSRGALMVEAVVSVFIFTTLGVAMLVGFQTTQTVGNKMEGQSIAENVARNQMEFLFSQAYQDPPTAYPTITPPAGYTVTANAQEVTTGDATMQMVTVSVSREGTTLLNLETIRTND